MYTMQPSSSWNRCNNAILGKSLHIISLTHNKQQAAPSPPLNMITCRLCGEELEKKQLKKHLAVNHRKEKKEKKVKAGTNSSQAASSLPASKKKSNKESPGGVFVEYDCSNSLAIEKLYFNRKKNEAVVKFQNFDKIYLYSECPKGIEKRFASKEPLGRVVSDIKEKSSCRQVSDYPRNVQQLNVKPKKQFPDYSEEWLQLLESAQQKSQHFFSKLLTLRKFKEKYPPSELPPDISSDTSEESQDSNENQSTTSEDIANAFELLSMDDEVTNHVKKHPEKISVLDEHRRSIQWRYLKVRIICGMVDSIRKEAFEAHREKNYAIMKIQWINAYNTLSECLRGIDPWLSMLQSKHFADQHNEDQLRELFEGFLLLAEDTEKHRDEALHLLEKRRNFLDRKLTPMLQSRDKAKESYGKQKWKENPSPKMDYAERRKQWEDELFEVMEAFNVIDKLNFLDLVRG